MSTDLKQEFWTRLADVRAGMLDTGQGRFVPMSPYAEADESAIWFITAKGTDLVDAAEAGGDATLMISDPKADLYAQVEGRIALVDDSEKLDEIWNGVAAAWFEDGREDDSVRLVKMTPKSAEVWATKGSAGFLYEIAKAHVTHDLPDMGDHGTVTF
ncbi:pyridoxamine 5'-phosphate oxidase family protein [Litorisediminicola beolgyonensis]|uniref:Pyridoxamine 5'-phosphate oxidase family protein n=1 Tax=Litorisediminicola beolgyonensis TaxID=1173614 RepID=A0ABW3ZNL1_9RHOB